MRKQEGPGAAGRRLLLLPALLALCLFCGFKWGFLAHKKINRAAVFTLPAEMLRFYKNNLAYITDQAVAADRRRYVVEEEAARHYLDVESYGEELLRGPAPTWEEAVERFSADTLREHGLLPWHILRMTARLTQAFLDRDSLRILRYSADLGHYLADAHVPLHTTLNYNGQLTGQTGIHGFWESRIPELFWADYNYFVGKARYISDLPGETWKIIRESHFAVDSVLSIEARLSREFPSDGKFAVYLKNSRPAQGYSEHYSRTYQERLGGMIERRLRAAVLSAGSFWYTAWVNAGQPSLNGLPYRALTREEAKQQENGNIDHTGAEMLGRKDL
ncbi:MAG TPA: zinc dependent phospholipase C family protein [Anseongella sp.]|nr:zinc dependent phospholipase C family protein [Anseongella sp.]